MGGRGRIWLLLVAAFYVASALLLYWYGLRRTIGIKDYISDECWYISSAVNVARKVLSLHVIPKINSTFAAYTIVYNQSRCNVTDLLELLTSRLHAYSVACSYSKLNAIAIYVPLKYVGLVEKLHNMRCVVDVVPGIMPDEANINNYLNTEHPPLVKLLYALLLYVEGFKMSVFRIASFAFALAGLAAVYAVVYWALKRWGVEALPALVIPLTVVLFDKSVQSMSSIAMLDIYAASLDTVALALLLYGRPLAASIALGLAGAAKYTGLFPYPALISHLYARRVDWRRSLALLALPLLIVALFWYPFIAGYGVNWTVDQIIGALKWHTSSRPPGGPPTTNPIGLLLGRPGFTLYYVDNTPYLIAASNPGVTLPALLIAVIAAVSASIAMCNGESLVSREDDVGILSASLALISTILGYAAVWGAGNHTLYNFYSVQLSLESAAILLLYPLLLKVKPVLERSSISLCLLKRGGAGWLYSLVVLFIVPLSALLVKPFSSASRMQPLYSMIALSPGKIEMLGLTATAMIAYAAAALKLAKSNPPQTPALLASQLAAWAAASLASLASLEAALAPLVMIAVTVVPGYLDALVLGLVMPSYTSCVLASRSGSLRRALRIVGVFVVAVASAYLLAEASHSQASIAAVAVALAGLACTFIPWQSAVALLPTIDPTLAPLLPLAPHDVRGESVLRAYATVMVSLYLLLQALGHPFMGQVLMRAAAITVALALAYSKLMFEKGKLSGSRTGILG
jgi:predicted membrane-bound dolichyl-phosphate-mannose-protein mannosyltransferase